MLGCFAWATDPTIHAEDDELEDVRWFTRDQVGQALLVGEPAAPFVAPNAAAIACQLLRAWYDGAASNGPATVVKVVGEKSKI